MEAVLEAIADAVSQLVLFSVEAEENNTTLPNIVPGANVVKTAVGALADVAQQIAESMVEEPQVQTKMRETAEEVKKSAGMIMECAQALNRNQYDKLAKKDLLRAGKSVLENTVLLLQLADKFEVLRIVKAAQLADASVKQAKTLPSNVVEVARALSYNNVNLSRLVQGRVDILPDPMYKRRLDEANARLKSNTEPIINALVEATRKPAARDDVERIGVALEDAIAEIIAVSKQSAKTLFDSIGLDRLLGLENYTKATPDDLRLAHEKVKQSADRLAGAAVRKDPNEMAAALGALQGDIGQEVTVATAIAEDFNDPAHRAEVAEACQEVEAMPNRLQPVVRRVLANPTDLANVQELRRLADDTKAASAKVVAATLPSNEAQVNKKTEIIEKRLQDLVEAVKAGKSMEAVEAVKAVADNVGQQAELGRLVAAETESPVKKELVSKRVEALEALPPELIKATKAALQSPGNREVLDDFLDRVEQTKAALRDLAKATTMTEDEALLEAQEALDEELRSLKTLLKEGAPLQQTAEAIRAIKNRIGATVAMARAMAQKCEDPEKRKRLLAAADELEALGEQLVPTAKKAVANPGNAQAMAEAVGLLNEIAAASKKLNEGELRATDDELLAVTRHLGDTVDQLQDALARGDTKAAADRLKELEKDIERQKRLLQEKIAATTDPAEKKALQALYDDLNRLATVLPRLAREAIADPKNEEKQRKLANALQELRSVNKRIEEALAPPPGDAMLLSVAKMDSGLSKVPGAIRTQNREEFDAAIRDVRDAVQGEITPLVKKLVEKDPQRAPQVVAAAKQLATLVPEYLAAADQAYAAPHDAAKQDRLEKVANQLKAAGAALASAAAPSGNLAEEAIASDIQLNNTLDQLNAALRTNDPQQIMNALKTAKDVLAKQAALARALAASTTDPERKRQLLEAADRLDKLSEQLTSAVREVLADPANEALKERVAQLSEQAKEASALVVAGSVDDPEKEFERVQAQLDEARARLAKAIREGDKEGAARALADIERLLQRQQALARAAAPKTTDPNNKKKLLAVTKDIRDKLLGMLDPLKKAINAGRLDANTKAMVDDFMARSDALKNAINDALHPEAKKKQEPKDEIAKAAFSISEAVDKIGDARGVGEEEGFDESTPEGKIFAASRRVAKFMNLLSQAAASGSKKDMIDNSRKIAAEIDAVVAAANNIASRCTDPKLREQLNSVAQAAKNFAVQVKIICAVKASTEENDPSAQSQLVKCSKLLAGTVVNICTAADIASIRVKK